jgi:hypothetical protein
MTLRLEHPGLQTWHLRVQSTAAMTSAGWAQQRRYTTITGGMGLTRLTEAARTLLADLRADPPTELIPVRRDR